MLDFDNSSSKSDNYNRPFQGFGEILMTIRSIIAAATIATLAGSAHAQIFAQWNFNSIIPDAGTSTGTTIPSIGTGTFSAVGGVTTTFASGDANGGSSDPATGDDSGLNTSTFAAQGTGSGARGVQFAVSTTGLTAIVVSWDQRHSNTSSRFVQFQYSTDGLAFTDFGSVFSASAGDTWFNNRSVDLSSISAVENNANFAFRIVSVFDPSSTNYSASTSTAAYSSAGTWRFDMVTVTSIPSPASAALLGLAGLAATRRRRA